MIEEEECLPGHIEYIKFNSVINPELVPPYVIRTHIKLDTHPNEHFAELEDFREPLLFAFAAKATVQLYSEYCNGTDKKFDVFKIYNIDRNRVKYFI